MSTHSTSHIAATGKTVYAYPTGQSLADWTTYRVSLAEGTGDNIGRYTGTLDDANGYEWLVFEQSLQPASWDLAVASISVAGLVQGAIQTLDALDTAQDAQHATTQAKTDNLPAAPAAVGDIPTTAEIEAALINEGDGQQLIDAILTVINSSLDLPALELTAIGQAVRAEIATELGRIDAAISTRLATAGYAAPLDSAAAQAASAAALTAYGPATAGDVPTAEAIRAEIDSNSTQLAAILADTAAIDTATAGGVTVVAFNPSTTAGAIELAQGDDYSNGDGRAISRTIAGAAFDVVSARITFKDVQTGTVSMAAVAGTVTSGTDPIGFYFELTAAQTAALAVGRNRHAYTIEVTTDTGSIVTIERGGVTVTEDAD